MVPLEERHEYDAAIAEGGLSVIAFLADWSKPSKALKAELSAACASRDDVKFYEVDLAEDEGEELALSVGVTEPPTVVVFRGGTKMAEFASAKGAPCKGSDVINAIAQLGAMDAAALQEAANENQRAFIRASYGATADGRGIVGLIEGTASGACCDVTPASTLDDAEPLDFGGMSERMGYTSDQVKALGNLGLGCGNPFTDAGIVQGETVLDLGSGAGFDCFLASKMVGASGLVIGVDMTQEMITASRANARQATASGLPPNTSFRLGEIEYLPVADNTVGARCHARFVRVFVD